MNKKKADNILRARLFNPKKEFPKYEYIDVKILK